MSPWLQKILGPFVFAALILLLVAFNVLQTLSLVLLVVSRRAFRSFNRMLAGTWWGLCVILARRLNRASLILSGDSIPMRENAIIVVNHRDMSDILLIMMLAMGKGRIWDLKWFVKDVLKYVPGIGWGMLFLDCVFVKRNWDADKDKIHSTFSKFQTHRIPIWLISFVEGTRFTQAKKIRSQEHAKERGLPILDNVLLPRTKGFVATVQGLSGYASAVYDLTIGHTGPVPSLWQIMTRKVNLFHMHVKRYPIEDLPEDPALLSQWLIMRFSEKDVRLDEFKVRGTF